MEKYEVIWSIKRRIIIEANNGSEARVVLHNLNPENAGEYIEDSFRIAVIEEIEVNTRC